MEQFTGKVWVLGDDIDTDIIIPTEYLALKTIEEMKQYGFSPLRPELAAQIGQGDILVAGRDFGCGSHREQAVTVLQALGIQALAAESIARLYFRNGIALGLPVFPASGIWSMTQQFDQLQIAVGPDSIQLKNCTSGQSMCIPSLSPEMREILEAGGIFPSLKRLLGGCGKP